MKSLEMPKDQVSKMRIGKYYEVTDIMLGQGSFSKVYLARHTLFGNTVALKIIDRNKIEEEYVAKNLAREASILKKLKHPNIVNFYEEFLHDQLYCLSMELVNGYDLSRFLNKQSSRKVSEKFAKILFFQMVSAVNYMHKAHVLHRDLKQENILLEHGIVIKIVDFGLSNVYYPHTRLLTHCGSLEYAAPELFEHKSIYGAGVDLWSLGVILYSMVIGKMPFVVPKESDGPPSHYHKEQFRKRISRGLTRENWQQMGDLSYDCCNLLEHLLQPNKWKRLQIRDAYVHPWLQKDGDLKKSLPQQRPDLQRRFKPEIMDWMAEKLCVPKNRIQNHLETFRFEKISAMYYIMLDTLVKEVLYPPYENMKNSFIFRLNNRQRTSKYGTYEDYDDDSSRAGLYEATTSRGFEVGSPLQTLKTFQSHPSRMHQKEYCGLLPKHRENGTRNMVDIRNRVGDGGHLDRRSNEKAFVLKSNHAFSKQEGKRVLIKDALKCSEPFRDQSATFAPKPFKSYKNSRPAKSKDMPGEITVEASNGQCKFSEEKRHHPIDISENSDHASKSSSVNLNYQRNMKLLNEKYGLKSKELSKSMKPDNKAGVQLTREWKRKPLYKKHEPNCTAIKSNGIRDYRASANTNGRVNPAHGNDTIYKPELVSKDSYHHSNKLIKGSKGREYNGGPKITEQIPAGKHCTKYFYSSQKQQHMKRSDHFNRTVDGVNGRYPNDDGQRSLRRNNLRAPEEVLQYDVLKKKPKKELLDFSPENKKLTSKT